MIARSHAEDQPDDASFRSANVVATGRISDDKLKWRLETALDLIQQRYDLIASQVEAGCYDLARLNIKLLREALSAAGELVAQVQAGGDAYEVLLIGLPTDAAMARIAELEQMRAENLQHYHRVQAALARINDDLFRARTEYINEVWRAMIQNLVEWHSPPAWYEVPQMFKGMYDQSKEQAGKILSRQEVIQNLRLLEKHLRKEMRDVLNRYREEIVDKLDQLEPVPELDSLVQNVVSPVNWARWTPGERGKPPEFVPPAVPEPALPKKTVGDALRDYLDLAMKGQKPEQSLEAYIESVTGVSPSAPGAGAQTPLSHQELLETYLAHQSESPGAWKEPAFEKATQPLVDMSEVLAEQVLAAVPEQQAIEPTLEEVDAQVGDWFGFDVADSDSPETKQALQDQLALCDALLEVDVIQDGLLDKLPAELRGKVAEDPDGVFGAHWHLLREMLPEDVREIYDELQDVTETLHTARQLADQDEPGAAVLYLMLKAGERVVRWLGRLLPPGVADTLAFGAELVPHAVQAGKTIQTFGLDDGRICTIRQSKHPINQILQNHTGKTRDELQLDTPDGPRIIRVFEWDTVEIGGETFYLALDDKDTPTGILVKHQPPGRWRFWDRDKVTVYQADTSRSPERGYTIGSVREANVLEPQR